MTFLPIAERELRIASRRASTYWIRFGGVLLASIVAAVYVGTLSNMRGVAINVGSTVFNILAWLAFIGVAAAGVFLSSDAISEEKREGTLGLLFLTDLRAYDVVFGKLSSSSIQAFYGLLAVAPVIGMPLLIGGVTGGDFWRAMVALLNGLFFSVAAGIFVSSLCKESQHAMMGTLMLLGFCCIGSPLLDLWNSSWNIRRLVPVISYTSPSMPLVLVSGKTVAKFWPILLGSHVCAWILLAATVLITPRSWQTGARQRGAVISRRKNKRRANALSKNPVSWFSTNQRWRWTTFLVFLSGLVLCQTFFRGGALVAGGGQLFVWYASLLVPWLFSLALASHASRFFVDGRRTGALELLLCTPLGEKEIVRGQWQALLTTFALPVSLLIVASVVSTYTSTVRMMTATQPSMLDLKWFLVVQSVLGLFSTLTGLASLAWFSMWMGVTSPKPTVAVLKAIVLVKIAPWFLIMILMALSQFFFLQIRTPGNGQIINWITMGATTVLIIVKDLLFIDWSRHRLLTKLRTEVAGAGSRSLSKMKLQP